MINQAEQKLRVLLQVAGLAVAATLLGAAQGADTKRPNEASDRAPASAPVRASTKDREQASGAGSVAKSVGQTLTEIERIHGVRIELDPSVDKSQPAPLMPGGMSPELRLQGLFVHYDLMFAYGRDAQTMMNRLQRVWVLPRGAVEAMQAPLAWSTISSSPAMQTQGPGMAGSPAFQSRDSHELGVELQRLSELATPEAGEILTRALYVDDDNVRLQAVRALSASANPGSIDALKRIAQEDRSEVLRAQALEALATISSLSSGELRGMLNDATNDPSPIVRELAQSLREALESPLDPVLRGEDN